MQRVDNYTVKLAEFANSKIGQRFSWGDTDCATLVRDAMVVMYGEDVLNLPEWHDLKSAIKVWRRFGSPDEFLYEKGAVPVKWNFLQSGDIIVEHGEDRHGFNSFGFIVGMNFVGAENDENGIIRSMPLSWLDPDKITAWRLP